MIASVAIGTAALKPRTRLLLMTKWLPEVPICEIGAASEVTLPPVRRMPLPLGKPVMVLPEIDPVVIVVPVPAEPNAWTSTALPMEPAAVAALVIVLPVSVRLEIVPALL